MKRWIAIAVLCAAGCQEPQTTGEGDAPITCADTATAIQQRPPKGDHELPTTAATQYLDGLDGQIAAAEKSALADATSATKQVMLASLLGARGKLFGNLDEVQRAIDLTTRAIELAPDDPAPRIERASLAQTLHRFPTARADVELAKTLGGSARAISAIEQELDWNEGHYERAIQAIRAARIARPNVFTVSREARLLHDLGDYAGADQLYAQAEELIDDTSPVVVAFLAFQRGYHAFEIGRLEEAIVFFREAVRRLPTWITAQEHLAELLVLTGHPDEAVTIYEDVTARSRDPELFAALARVYRALDRGAEADTLDARARVGFDEYATKFPEAAWAHASEFYLAAGNDPARAVAMRESNVRLRPNATSLAALAEAYLAIGDRERAKTAVERALQMPVKSGYIAWTAARVAAAMGDRARTENFAADACALNPRVSMDLRPIRF